MRGKTRETLLKKWDVKLRGRHEKQAANPGRPSWKEGRPSLKRGLKPGETPKRGHKPRKTGRPLMKKRGARAGRLP